MAKIPSNKSASKFPTVTYRAIEDGDYDARMVRFIGLGVQEQPEFDNKKKEPAFKCAIQFELVDMDVTGIDENGNEVEPRPACQFAEFYLFPGATRGNVFNLCKILDPSIEKVPDDLEWFMKRLGAPLNARVGHYISKKTGEKVNKIAGLNPIPQKYLAGVKDARTELVGFDPYEDTPEMFESYSKLYKFQREILAGAHDASVIPFAGKEPAKKTNPSDTAQPSTGPVGPDTDTDDDSPF